MEYEPTILNASDIDRFVESLMNSEIKKHQCYKCSKEYYEGSYGHQIGECDECWFAHFPREEVQAFHRSFLE